MAQPLPPSDELSGERMLTELLSRYENLSLEEAIGSERFSNQHGDCHMVNRDCSSEFRSVDLDNIAQFCKREDVSFDSFSIMDIETLGLSFDAPVILFGLVKIQKGSVGLSQFLVHDVCQELAALTAFKSHIDKETCLVTYNGQNFDVPYIKQRLVHYDQNVHFGCKHTDVIFPTRRMLSKRVPDCRQCTIEDFFGLQRGINIPGWLVPSFYSRYQETGNVGPLVPLVNHNKEDLINLALIVSRLQEYREQSS